MTTGRPSSPQPQQDLLQHAGKGRLHPSQHLSPTTTHDHHDRLHPAEIAERQRRGSVSLARAAFFIVIVTVALLTVLRTQEGGVDNTSALSVLWWIPILIALILYGLAVGVDVLLPRKRIATISGVLFGAVAGVLATVALSAVIDLLARTWLGDLRIEIVEGRPVSALEAFDPHITTLKVLLGIALVYLGVSTVIQTQDDFRLVIPYVEFSRQYRGTKPLLIDSATLIDSRIVDLAATGLIQAPLVIPRFVIDELQRLADSADRTKRAKGRRALDAVSKLQRAAPDVAIEESDVPGPGADAQLVELARRNHGSIITSDYALRRIAQIQGVSTISMHDIALAVRPTIAPGDRTELRLVKPGEQQGQAVGYLEDGTMVVVERSADRIGQPPIEVEVTSLMQTAAGRLVFAVPTDLTPVTNTPSAAPAKPTQIPKRQEQRETPAEPTVTAGPPTAIAAAQVTAHTEAGFEQPSDTQHDASDTSGINEFSHNESPNSEPRADDPPESDDGSHEDQPVTQPEAQPTSSTPIKPGPFPPKRFQRRSGNARNPRR